MFGVSQLSSLTLAADDGDLKASVDTTLLKKVVVPSPFCLLIESRDLSVFMIRKTCFVSVSGLKFNTIDASIINSK